MIYADNLNHLKKQKSVCAILFNSLHPNQLLTPTEPQSRLGDKLLEFGWFVPEPGLRF